MATGCLPQRAEAFSLEQVQLACIWSADLSGGQSRCCVPRSGYMPRGGRSWWLASPLQGRVSRLVTVDLSSRLPTTIYRYCYEANMG